MTDSLPQNKIVIITAPSGAGKTSIVHYLLDKYPEQLAFSVSAATREARSNETNGVDYYFLTMEEFQKKIEHNEFVEWEMVYEGKYYGTLKTELERIWALGKTPVLDIDVKGAIHVKRQYPNEAISLFIQPPSFDELRKRLLSRGTESHQTLTARINKANYEISFKDQFDHIVINEHLEKACAEAESLIVSYLHIV